VGAAAGVTLKVGQQFGTRREPWPCSPHLYLAAEPVLYGVFIPSPTPHEIAGVQWGLAEFAWVEGKHEGFLLSRFSPRGLPWSDCPYSPHRESVPAVLPVLGQRQQLVVTVMLVDSLTSRIAALRALTWPAHFANAVRATVGRLAHQPYDPQAAKLAAEQVYERYPLGEGAQRWVRERAVATCRIRSRRA
jgi:hypothetical protein